MHDVSRGSRKAICCFWGVIVLCTIRAHAAPLPPDPTNAALLYYQAFLLRPEPNEAEKELVYNGTMDKTYEYLRGAAAAFDPNVEPRLRELEAKLGPRPARSGPMGLSDYYDLSLLSSLREEHARQERTRGIDPNRAIRDYIRRCQKAVEFAQTASELPECDWGIRHSQGIAFPLSQLTEIRSLAFVLRTDALIHAADGDYRMAFERCLMMRRVARQVGDDTYLLYGVSKALDCQALRCMQFVLGYMEPDADTLEWLKHQFGDEAFPLSSPARALRMDFEHVLQSLRNDKEMVSKVREAMRLKGQIRTLLRQESAPHVGHTETGQGAERVTDEELEELNEIMTRFKQEPEQAAGNVESVRDTGDLTDEALVALAAKSYAAFLDSALGVMESDVSYRDKIPELTRLEEDIENEYGNNRVAKQMMLTHPERAMGLSVVIACSTELAGVYTLHVRHRADVNAVVAGIEIHLVNARQGRLPERLPEGLPRDPFTGRDFKYEITEDGFVLSLPDEDIAGDGRPPYGFRVR
jgi:hypothetical protein